MNFTEWSTALSKQQERMKETALIDVEESLSVDNRQISVILGKGRESGMCRINGIDKPARLLRHYYTHHKVEFDAMLDSVTTSVDTVMEASDHLMESMTEDAIPDAMIERMKGEQTSGEPKELILASVTKKMEALHAILSARMAFKTSGDRPALASPDLKAFVLEFPSIAGRQLSLELAWGKLGIIWGKVMRDANGNCKVEDHEEGMYFLANYDFIEATLLKACGALMSVRNS